MVLELELEPEQDETESFLATPTKPQNGGRFDETYKKVNYTRTARNQHFVTMVGLVIVVVIGFWITYNVRHDSTPEGFDSFNQVPNESTASSDRTSAANTSTLTHLNRKEHDDNNPYPLPSLSNSDDSDMVMAFNQSIQTEIFEEQDQVATTKSPSTNQSSLDIKFSFGSNEYLQRADRVIERAMSAILAEYGQKNIDFGSYNEASIPPMFAWTRVDLNNDTQAPEGFRRRGNRGNGGWTSNRSWDGLVKRLVYAMSTKGDFAVVLGGHSAAAGHGNHFQQSYLMQFQKVMEPVFRQLHVNLVSRNQAQGGLGTVHSSLGFSSIYGNNIDLMLWDAGMTEKHKPEHIDLFYRQALLVEGRVPVVWAAGGKFDLLRMLHNSGEADVGEFGLGLDGIPETSEANVGTLPWAVQRLQCSEDERDLCKNPHKFCATCWIDRPDAKRPAQNQYDTPHGQVKWHPGWRSHQLTGRVLAFSILQALKDALGRIRSEDDSIDGMREYYDNIRKKVKSLDPSMGTCHRINTTLPERICQTSMKGRTQYTPRNQPEKSSITSILKPAPDGYVPQNPRTKPLYQGPDMPNPCLELPAGAVDVVAEILGESSESDGDSQRRLEESTSIENPTITQEMPSRESVLIEKSDSTKPMDDPGMATGTATESETDIVPGLGWQVFDEPQGYCDGTLGSVCAKSTWNRCVLYGHHDERGAVLGNELSGWLVLQVPRSEIQAGIIVVKLHTWYEPRDNTKTAGWTTINNLPDGESSPKRTVAPEDEEMPDDPKRKRLLRKRSYETPPLGKWFQFDYAIDGVVTTLNETSFLDQKQDIQRMVEVLTLMDDDTFASGGGGEKSGPLEVAIRMRGCGRHCVFGVTHLYWA